MKLIMAISAIPLYVNKIKQQYLKKTYGYI